MAHTNKQSAERGYRQRAALRARAHRAELGAMRVERERLQLTAALRRELRELADGASALSRSSRQASRLGSQNAILLARRRRRAVELLEIADRFDLSLDVVELDLEERTALGLPPPNPEEPDA